MEQAHPPPEQSRRLPDGPLGVSRISHLFIGSDSVRGVIDDGVDIGLDDSLIEQFARLRLVFFHVSLTNAIQSGVFDFSRTEATSAQRKLGISDFSLLN